MHQYQKERQLVKETRRFGVDITQLLHLYKKKDVWGSVRGILPKKPTGLQHQRRLRAEWL